VLGEGVVDATAVAGEADSDELTRGEGAGGVGVRGADRNQDAFGLTGFPRRGDRPLQDVLDVTQAGDVGWVSGHFEVHGDELAVDQAVGVGLVPEVEVRGVAGVKVEGKFEGRHIETPEGVAESGVGDDVVGDEAGVGKERVVGSAVVAGGGETQDGLGHGLHRDNRGC